MTNLNLIKLEDTIYDPQTKRITIKNCDTKCMEGLLLVYADWCGHCRQFKPIYTYLTEMFNQLEQGDQYKNFKISGNKPKLFAIDHEQNNKVPVTSFPTIFKITDMSCDTNKKTVSGKLSDYKSGRSFNDIINSFTNTEISLSKK